MKIEFNGKIVLVTGASTGIGAAMAAAFGEAGATVVVHYNSSEQEARATADRVKKGGGQAFMARADIMDKAQVDAMVRTVIDTYSRIDVLVNNAGGLVRRFPIDEMPDDDYYRVIDLNITSVFRMCKLVVPFMKKSGGGAIINLSSIAARNGGGGGAVVYAAAKAAVSTLTRGLAKEVASFNIRVNAIAPGIILTPFHDKYTPPEVLQNMIQGIPLGRGASAEELAGTALYLASDKMSSFVTGEVIEINGGALMA